MADAYDWPVDLDKEDVITKLFELNQRREAEEKAGTIRWLRPEYQAPVTKVEVQGKLL